MSTFLTVLSVLAAWTLLGVLLVGLLLTVKSLQSIRHWFEKTTVSVRTAEHQTADLAARGEGRRPHGIAGRDDRGAARRLRTTAGARAGRGDPMDNLTTVPVQARVDVPLEEFDSDDTFTGIDIFRAIRSFDPCMPCTVHVAHGDNMIVRDATTCACGGGLT